MCVIQRPIIGSLRRGQRWQESLAREMEGCQMGTLKNVRSVGKSRQSERMS